MRQKIEKLVTSTDPIDPTLYLSQVGNKIQFLLRRIQNLKQNRPSTQGTLALSEALIRILSQTFSELERLSGKVNELDPYDIIAKTRILHDSSVIIIQPLIEAIAAAEIDSPINGVIDAYSAICIQAQFGTRFTMYPKWEYNVSYREVMDVLRSIARNINLSDHHSIFEGAFPYHVIVTYPASIEDITLHQCVIAHEVGHFIDFVRNWSKDVMNDKLIPQNARQDYAALSNEERKLLNQFCKPWIREVVADTIATCILGPAYIYALEEFTYITPHDPSIPGIISSSHPPKDLRLLLISRLCLNSQLDEVQRLPEFKELTPREEEVYKQIRAEIERKSQLDLMSIQVIKDNPQISVETAQLILQILMEILSNVVELIEARATETLTETWTCSAIDILHATVLQNNFHYSLTPTQLPTHFNGIPSFAAIMNSGWYFLQDSFDEFHYFKSKVNSHLPEEFCEKYMVVQQLVAKAIESLNFQREYISRRRKS
jgi:hypothetical protein